MEFRNHYLDSSTSAVDDILDINGSDSDVDFDIGDISSSKPTTLVGEKEGGRRKEEEGGERGSQGETTREKEMALGWQGREFGIWGCIILKDSHHPR